MIINHYITGGLIFIELLKQKMLLGSFLLSKTKQLNSHKQGILAGYHFLLSIILVVLSYFLWLSSSMKLGTGVDTP